MVQRQDYTIKTLIPGTHTHILAYLRSVHMTRPVHGVQSMHAAAATAGCSYWLLYSSRQQQQQQQRSSQQQQQQQQQSRTT